MVRSSEVPEGSPCPCCGRFVPQVRKDLLGVDTCKECTEQPKRVKRVKVTSGGGNARVQVEYAVSE